MKIIKFLTILGLLLCMGCDTEELIVIHGCTDSSAGNYNPEATDDDGNCYYGPVLFINEFMASNDTFIEDPDDDGTDPFDDWIEIYNPNDDDIDLAGMFLADGHLTGHMISYDNTTKTTIPAGGYLVFWFDDEPDEGILHIPEKLGGDGDGIYLYDVDSTTIIDSHEYSQQYGDVSMARPIMTDPEAFFFGDNRDNWVLTMTPTPGAENVIDSPVFGCTDSNGINYDPEADIDDGSCIVEGVYINELYENGEWIELYNNMSETVDIAGWFIQLDNDSWQIPVDALDTEIASGGFMILYADEDDDFPHLGEELTLNSYGGIIVLYESDGTTQVDSISYDEQDDEKSLGRYPDGSDIWKFTTPTPGAINEYTPDVVLTGVLFINEILASNDNAVTDEFGEFDDCIELYNSSSEAIDIGGLYVSDNLDELTKHQIPVTNPELTSVPPKGFLVLWFDSQAEQGVLHVGTKLSSGGEDAVLVDADGTTIIDSYTFGAQTTDVSIGRSPDGSNNWVEYDSPSIGETNP